MPAQTTLYRSLKVRLRLLNGGLASLLAVSLVSGLLLPPSQMAWAQGVTDSSVRGLGESGFRNSSIIKLNELENPSRSLTPTSSADIFPVVNLNLSTPQPLSLSGIKISGLSPENIKTLAYYHMVVLHGSADQGTAYDTMYGIYQNNRLSGRSNFVTADTFVHAYFTYMNTLTVKVVEDTLYQELYDFLKDLRDSCVKDYRICDIAEIKDDIQRNLGFILVSIKLLRPDEPIPDMGGASDLAQAEIALMKKGQKANSPIFSREIDYASFRPAGFYGSLGSYGVSRAARFYSSYSWLSRMALSLSDLTINTQSGGGNSFRRAVLLFRAVQLGRSADGKTLMEKWRRLTDIVLALSQGQLSKEPTIYPEEMKAIFTDAKLEFKDLLVTLAQPLARARLLISIKKQKPQGLDATSIFDMTRARKEEDTTTVFRLFVPVSSVELDFLKELAASYQEEGQDKAIVPLSLLNLFAMGCPQASNALSVLAEQIDSRAINIVPDFVRVLSRRRPEDADVMVRQTEKRWSLISEYFRPLKKGSQACLLSTVWMQQRLLSASGAFVDSFLTIDTNLYPPPPSAPGTSVGNTPAKAPETATAGKPAAAAAVGAATAGSATGSNPASVPPPVSSSSPNSSAPGNTSSSANTRRSGKPAAANFHYLEPSIGVYSKIAAFLSESMKELTRLNAMPESLRTKGDDFVRLTERLVKISEKELGSEPLPLPDFRLLANIDQILPAISGPTSACIYTGSGASMGLGDPGALFILFNTDQGPYLSRGAVYSYYEVAGGPYKPQHWQRKKSFGFLRPPGWISQFNLVDEKKTDPPGSAPAGKTVDTSQPPTNRK